MGWPFGLAKKKIEQVPPSQTGTGTPGDLSWIDDIRQKRAKLQEKRDREAAKYAEELQRAITYRMDSFIQLVKAGLPRGVEIVDVFIDPTHYKEHERADHSSQDHPVVRIDLGVGVRFDLRLVAIWLSHGDGPTVRTDHIIQIYEAESPYTKENVLGKLYRYPGHGDDRPMSEHLYDALQKYNSKSV